MTERTETAQTARLSDFLLARIADDEERARFVESQVDDWHRNNRWEPWRLSWHDEYDLLCIEPPRALAECEAKRRIVEWHGERDDCCEERLGPLVLDAEPELSAGVDSFGQLTMRQSIGVQHYIGCVTLMMLALPYADHPDYREEWRP